MAFYNGLFQAIPDYTGLSPAAFFTILGLMIAVYHLVSGMFVGPDDHRKHPAAETQPYVPPEPVQMGDVTEEELRAYDGSDPKKPLLMAIKGQIYDVSMSRMFYGPGGPYALFAGKDASRALALMSFEPKDLTGDIEGLSAYELETLRDWELKFMEKYVKVGQIVKENTSSEDTVNSEKTRGIEEPSKETENIITDSGTIHENGEKIEGIEESKKETEHISKDLGIIDEAEVGKI
ncbi:hypothetical protein MRB53_009545 [Persea americana]|uniref:Uncharacterized protein n=1 Tax=Persea americana TaxID=3435 RepID=A0ACC2LQ48_PERAE|nr:hypothetical protein MRB53_009545 [Persea americana]